LGKAIFKHWPITRIKSSVFKIISLSLSVSVCLSLSLCLSVSLFSFSPPKNLISYPDKKSVSVWGFRRCRRSSLSRWRRSTWRHRKKKIRQFFDLKMNQENTIKWTYVQNTLKEPRKYNKMIQENTIKWSKKIHSKWTNKIH